MDELILGVHINFNQPSAFLLKSPYLVIFLYEWAFLCGRINNQGKEACHFLTFPGHVFWYIHFFTEKVGQVGYKHLNRISWQLMKQKNHPLTVVFNNISVIIY